MPIEPPAASDSYRILLDEIGAFVYTTDLEGRYTYANRPVIEQLGQASLEAVLGKAFTEFSAIAGTGAALGETGLRVLRDGETVAREETDHTQATGETRTCWSLNKPLRDAAGRIVGMLGISHDITGIKRVEAKLREQKELLNAVLDNIEGMVYVNGADRRFRYANRQLSATFGGAVEDTVGRRDSEVMPREVADDWWRKDRQILASGQRYAGEESLVDASGSLRHYWRVVVPWSGFDGSPALIGLITDITELHALKQELERQSRTDHLTGAANSRSFHERAEQEFARSRRHGFPLSLLAIDIDHFKRINDAFGHPAGDAVLRAFAKECARGLRKEDLLARTGGEEFCVLLPQTVLDEAHVIAEHIRVQLATQRVSEQHPELRITASFGVAQMASRDADFRALFSRADRALYAAKRSGRNRSCALADTVSNA